MEGFSAFHVGPTVNIPQIFWALMLKPINSINLRLVGEDVFLLSQKTLELYVVNCKCVNTVVVIIFTYMSSFRLNKSNYKKDMQNNKYVYILLAAVKERLLNGRLVLGVVFCLLLMRIHQLIQREISLSLRTVLPRKLMLKLSLVQYLESVSYTHLDVYKRQM